MATSAQKKLIALFCILTGLGLMGWKGYQVAAIQMTRGWPQTEAAVVDLRPYQETRHSTDSNSTSYRLAVRFEYEVDGREFTGENYFRGGDYFTGMQNRRDELLRELRADGKVTIYHHPRDPADSFVAVTSGEDIGVGILIGSFFLFIGILILFAKNPSQNAQYPPAQ